MQESRYIVACCRTQAPNVTEHKEGTYFTIQIINENDVMIELVALSTHENNNNKTSFLARLPSICKCQSTELSFANPSFVLHRERHHDSLENGVPSDSLFRYH